MDCPKCGYKMKCTNTNCEDNITGRRYKCLRCGIALYTIEKVTNSCEANNIIIQKLKRH